MLYLLWHWFIIQPNWNWVYSCTFHLSNFPELSDAKANYIYLSIHSFWHWAGSYICKDFILFIHLFKHFLEVTKRPARCPLSSKENTNENRNRCPKIFPSTTAPIQYSTFQDACISLLRSPPPQGALFPPTVKAVSTQSAKLWFNIQWKAFEDSIGND